VGRRFSAAAERRGAARLGLGQQTATAGEQRAKEISEKIDILKD
jgi:hypothetical protein